MEGCGLKEQIVESLVVSHSLKSRHFWFFLIWLASGIVIFNRYRHFVWFFPAIIFVWLLVNTAWFGASRLKWWAVLVAPVLAGLVCLPLTYAYWEYADRESERALDEFVRQVAEGDSALEFSLDSQCTVALPQMAGDLTLDYEVMARDRFGVEYEWMVKFANGSTYYFAMVQESPGQWEVYVCDERTSTP